MTFTKNSEGHFVLCSRFVVAVAMLCAGVANAQSTGGRIRGR